LVVVSRLVVGNFRTLARIDVDSVETRLSAKLFSNRLQVWQP